MYYSLLIIIYVPVQHGIDYLYRSIRQQKKGCIFFWTDDNNRMQSYTRLHHSRTIRYINKIYDLSEWWDLRGAISMRRLGPVTYTINACFCFLIQGHNPKKTITAHSLINYLQDRKLISSYRKQRVLHIFLIPFWLGLRSFFTFLFQETVTTCRL